MVLDFTINSSAFLQLGGLWVLYFAGVWGIAHAIKIMRY